MATFPEALNSYDAGTPGNNTPAGGDPVGTELDDHLRDMKAKIREAGNLTPSGTSSVSVNMAVTHLNQLILVDPAAADTTVNFLAAATAGSGFRVGVKNVTGANNVILEANGAETIDGVVSLTLSATYQTAILTCDGTSWHVSSEAKATRAPSADGVLAPHKNLVVKYVTDDTVDIDADELWLTDASGNGLLVSSVNETTVDMSGGVAENSLDTGAEANDTWYYLWVFSDGSNVQCRLSVSATSPTVPSGYDYKGLVGAVYNATAAFRKFEQRDKIVSQTGVEDTGLGAQSATAITSDGIALPAGAKAAYGTMAVRNTNDESCSATIQPTTTSGFGRQRLVIPTTITTTSQIHGNWRCMVVTDQTLYYLVNDSQTDVDISIEGFEW